MRGTNLAASNAEESVGNTFGYTVAGFILVVLILVASSTKAGSNVYFLKKVGRMSRTWSFGAIFCDRILESMETVRIEVEIG